MLSMLVPGIVRTRPSEQPSDISGNLRGMRELQSSSKVHALESAVKKREDVSSWSRQSSAGLINITQRILSHPWW